MILAGYELRQQLGRSDWRLQILMADAARRAQQLQCHLRLTSVERTREHTVELYEDAGREPPRGPGVHDVRPCRGGDGIPEPFVPGVSIAGVGQQVAQEMNEVFVYPRGYRAVLWHDVDGWHWHFQVPWDGLVLLPDGG